MVNTLSIEKITSREHISPVDSLEYGKVRQSPATYVTVDF
jgi:hypothetical protein